MTLRQTSMSNSDTFQIKIQKEQNFSNHAKKGKTKRIHGDKNVTTHLIYT